MKRTAAERDKEVLDALARLWHEMDGAPFATDISRELGCGAGTVRDALYRLRRRGEVVRMGLYTHVPAKDFEWYLGKFILSHL